MGISFLSLIILFILFVVHEIFYYSGEYYKSTNRFFIQVLADKGAFGEYLIYLNLRPFEKVGARFLFNCYLPKNNGETSEIDVLMIFRSGIYVFESKNYGGWIFGSESNKTWTQTFPSGRGSRKEHFYNPIMQNSSHIKWLQKNVMGIYPIHSIIAFSDKCEFKNLTIYSPDVIVTHRSSVFDYVNSIDNRIGIVLDEDNIERIFNQLYPYTQVSPEVKYKHVSDIVYRPADVYSMDRCPRCGGTLVLRTARKGSNAGNQFFGCSNYPRCRYIKNIE